MVAVSRAKELEVAGFPAESALDAVGRVCVAAVEDLGEQEHEQFDHLAWEALLSEGCGELVNGHGQVADVSGRSPSRSP